MKLPFISSPRLQDRIVVFFVALFMVVQLASFFFIRYAIEETAQGTLREELRPRGIRVIALLPGATDTDIWDAPWPNAPRKKMMSAETVAQAAVDALLLPGDTTVEEVTIVPTAGAL